MKSHLIILAVCGTIFSAKGQSGQDMLEQVIALKALVSTVESEYKIVEDGLHTIRDIKQAEFDLHHGYFSSLLIINPAIGSMPEVDEIYSLGNQIVTGASASINSWQSSGWYSASKMDFAKTAYDKIMANASEDIKALQALVTDGDLQLSDGERMIGIDAIDKDMRKQYALMKEFAEQFSTMGMQRMHDKADLNVIKNLYGL